MYLFELTSFTLIFLRQMAVYLSTQGRESSRSPHHAIIDKSVNEIEDKASYDKQPSNLRSVKTHDGLESIGQQAFLGCKSLVDIDIRSVEILDAYALAESG
jgi:hypothetical protein